MTISTTQEILAELRAGRMVVIMDDEDRENEGDLLIAADVVRPEDVNFMARHGRGLICLTLTPERCRQLNLAPMVSDNRTPYATRFTVSIEAARGVTTGISAADRATTIRAAVRPEATADDLIQPGHIFPLMSQRGGVLARAGHTEAGVDLARLAGFSPSAVICEILKEDGSMARLPELESFAREHGLKIGTIADLIRYRLENEASVQRIDTHPLTTEYGEFQVVVYHDDIEDRLHLALVRGTPVAERPTLVRVHVHSTPYDLFTERHRHGSWSLHAALARIADAGEGVVVILDQPEPTLALRGRLRTRGSGSPDVAGQPGRDELRTYGLGGQILADLGLRRLRVLSHPKRAPALSGFGLEIIDYLVADDHDAALQRESL
ncbi:MAG TPA: bifunctional 3,4-dihydroxy-2-butanone-4-phosphate synthase/GTP cyclohydrolase II [Acidiferrobacteraceae bacterium]|nr:bifunctional 3,4-dihydroxy-2-butanone-4-phosphate synthase/GTP cyclohydrolase II [Acidiferrobacteraceae bacterium]